jgi:hypothetical protein
MLSSLLSGEWSGWLRGPNKRLREVPALAATAAAIQRQQQQVKEPGHVLTALLPVLPAPGGAAAAAAAEAAAAATATGCDVAGLQNLLRLWQQQWQPAVTDGAAGIRQQQQQCMGLGSLYQQRLLDALPVPGMPAVQLPGWVVEHGAAGDQDTTQQHAAGCNVRLPVLQCGGAGALTDAAVGRGATAAEAAAAATAHGGVAQLLLQGCVLLRREQLLYVCGSLE